MDNNQKQFMEDYLSVMDRLGIKAPNLHGDETKCPLVEQ